MAKNRQDLYLINWRSLSSFFLAFSGILILVSGIVLFIAAPGRYAHAADWRIIGLNKEQWETMHSMFCLVAVIFSIVHLAINWKVLTHYLWDRTKHTYRLKRELTISILLTLFIGAGSIFAWAPFSTIMDWGETISNSWEENNAVVMNEQDTLLVSFGDITDASDSTIEAAGGWGRYTIADICVQQNVTIEDAIIRLASYSIDADEETRIRFLADSHGYEASEILDIILSQPLGFTEDSD